MKTYTGIDVSKAKLDICVKDIEGTILHSQTFPNTDKGVEMLQKRIPKESKIVIESTSHYHWLVCLKLSELFFEVSVINPLLTKKYERSSIRGAKTDIIDARRLADIARIESDLTPFFDSKEVLTKKKYKSLLAKLSQVRQELKRSHKSALEALETVGVSVDFTMIEKAIHAIESAIDSLKKILEKNADALAKKAAEVPGVSLFQATVLSTAISGRTFQTREELVAFFGLDVRKRESGVWRGKECISKRGNPFYRKILFQLGWSLKTHNEKYRTYYENMMNRGKHYFTCILATARKFLREFFRFYKEVSL